MSALGTGGRTRPYDCGFCIWLVQLHALPSAAGASQLACHGHLRPVSRTFPAGAGLLTLGLFTRLCCSGCTYYWLPCLSRLSIPMAPMWPLLVFG